MDLYYCGLKGHFYTNTMADKTNLILPDYEYALPSSFIFFNLVTYLYLDYMMDPNLRNGDISWLLMAILAGLAGSPAVSDGV